MWVRAGRVSRGFRLTVRPSVPWMLARYVGRWVWDWRREAVALVVLWWLAGVFGPGAGRVGLLVLVAVVFALPWSRRALLGWLAGGRWRRRWAAACRACGLSISWERTPRVRRVRRSAAGAVLAVQVRPGQSIADLERAVPGLAAALGARGLTVAADARHAGRATVTVRLRESLRRTVDPEPLPVDDTAADDDGLDDYGLDADAWSLLPAAMPAPVRPARRTSRLAGGVDLSAVPVGRREDGGRWLLPLAGSHVLVAGATGAGKGSVLWAIVRALAPAVRAGLVEIWAVDPKGGMELAGGAPLFARFAWDPVAIADLLDEAAERMTRRAGRLRGVARVHRPTPGDPLVVVLVDEIAFLTAYGPVAVRRRVAESLPLLLTQGRAPGFVVVGGVQDPRKDVLTWRDLFPVRVCLRMSEDGQVDLVLGRGAHAAGAHAELIPMDRAGTGYVRTDEAPIPVLVRAAWQDDDDIHTVATRYGHPAVTPDPVEPPEQQARPVVAPRPAPSAPRRPVVGWVPDVSAVPPPAALRRAERPVDPVDPPTVPLRGWSPPPPPELLPGRVWPPVPPPPVPPRISESDQQAWESWAADWRRRQGLDDDGQPLTD
ncbi:FtsK/SpoIIIE domain-containing protein [Pseudofrankia sp. BMG5.37]|nr:FtsK/SpoIIIE domain-containing protein [Pseudofrankia sp. BMG5.37]